MPALTVQNAEIKTAAVEVKTLTISGKQVTLAVFRQLQESPLIAEDGTLNGVPWGRVNYHPDKCGGEDADDHWHVVWQLGDTLLRSRVVRNPRYRTLCPEHGTAFIDAHIRDVLSGAGSRFWQGTVPGGVNSDLVLDQMNGMQVALRPGAQAQVALVRRHELDRTEKDIPSGTNPQVWFYEARRDISASAVVRARRFVLDECLKGITGDVERSFAQVMEEVNQEAARRQRHADARKAIADLPQLFIAV